MAQIKIRKFNPGGVLRTETGDVFTLEEIEKLAQENPTNENLRDIANEMRAGRDVTHSVSDNWSSVTSKDFTNGQKRRVSKGPNSLARRLGATFNTGVHQYGEDVNDTTNVLSAALRSKTTADTSETPVSSDDFKLIAAGDGSSFVYDPETGVYTEGDFTNARLMSLLENVDQWLNDDGTGKYKFKGLGSDIRSVLKSMYDKNQGFIKDLMFKVRSGKIIEGSPEASILKQLGIGSNMTKVEQEEAAKLSSLKNYFINLGFSEEQFKELLPFVELDGQGLKLKAGVEGAPFIAGQNYYFNDKYNGPFKDLLKGQILFNNRFYDAEQLAQSGMITDWVKALKEHRFADADAMIRWDWEGVADKYDYNMFDNQTYYNDFLNGKRYLDVTGQYEKKYDGHGKEYQIIGYYDPNDANTYTSLGFVDPSKIKYARFDSMGNLVDENYDVNMLRKALNPWKHTTVFRGRLDDGRVDIPTITTKDGNAILGMDVTFDPDKGTVQFQGGMVSDILGSQGNAIELDGEIAKILSPEFFNNLEHASKKDITKFRDTILSLVGNKMGNLYVRNQLSRSEWSRLLRPTYGENADRYANIIYNYFRNYIGRTDWRNKASQITGLGIAPILTGFGLWAQTGQVSRNARLHEFARSYQQGGLFTGSAMPTASAPKIVQSDSYKPATTEEAGAFQFSEFTDADWMELAGLGADLASVVTGLSGFTPVSVATGLAGTASTFMADIKRDGFQGKDLGNLGMGLLFDAASIVPILGVGASTGKVMKAVKKSLPVLMKLAGIAGIGSSLSLAVNKIRSGEELTMKDLRIIMNGVLGTYTMAKQGIDVTNRRKSNGAEIDVDLQKLHMDKIDASNLSDVEKAAVKHVFDGGDYSAGLTGDKLRMYQQFIADGGDDVALKMLIGDNDVFVQFRKDRELLKRAKDALSGGTPLSDQEIKDYSKLLNDNKIRQHMTQEEATALFDMSAENQELARLLKIANDPTVDAAARTTALNDIDARFRHDVATGAERAEYKEFFKAWDAMPTENRYDQLNKLLRSKLPDFHEGMFTKRNEFFGKDGKWAAEVKQREKIADDLLAEFNPNRIKDADQSLAEAHRAYNEASSTGRVPSDLEKNLGSETISLKTKYDDLKAERDRLVAKQSTKKGLNKTEAQRLSVLDDKVTEAEVNYKRVKKEYEAERDANRKSHSDRIAELKQKIEDAKIARQKAIDAEADWNIRANDAKSRKILDNSTGEWKKTAALSRDVNTVESEFNIDYTNSRKALQDEFNVLRRDAAEAKLQQDRKNIGDRLIAEQLEGENQIKRIFDDVVEAEYSRLSDAEKAKVSELLNKKISDLSDEEKNLLMYYTAKQNGSLSGDTDATFDALKNKLQSDDAFVNFTLKEDVGISGVNALLKKAGIPDKSKLLLNEVDWAKIKKAENPGAELAKVLEGKGIKKEVVTEIVNKVTTQEEVAEGGLSWFKRKKKGTENSEETTTKKVISQLDPDLFKSRHKSDNSLWGKILGRSSAQEAYKNQIYRPNATTSLWTAPRDVQRTAQRYYQPMLHGMLYNVSRNPVHYTPSYESKEININEEED